MRLIPLRAWMLVIVSALLQIFCFPIAGQIPFWREGICWFSLVPLLLALWSPGRTGKPLTLKQSAFLGYGCGVIWYVSSCSWIYQTMYLYGGLAKPVAFLILVLFALYLGLYHALFAFLLSFTRTIGSGALLLAPVMWVAVELARARVTGFPWDLLGNALVDHSWMTRIAPHGGVMAMSFVVVAVNACIAFAMLRPKRSELMVAGLALPAVLLLHFSGMYNFGRAAGQALGHQVAVMMQENLAVGATAKSERPLTREEELRQFSAWSLRPERPDASRVGMIVSGGKRVAPTLIIWPEAPAHLQTNDPKFLAAMTNLAHTADAPVIAGSLGVDFDKTARRGYSLYDSAALFDRGGTYRGRYDKIHLVPWGEYVPYKQFFSFAEKLTEGVGDMDPGHDRSVFGMDGHTYGVFVCYESIFGDEVRHFVQEGAEVLVNISDDGWYGDTGAPWQHLNMARMRAIENRRWVLRSTNTGVTTTIDPYGRYIDTKRHVRVAYSLPFGFESGETFYTRYGDWFAYLCAVVTVVALGLGWARGRRSTSATA